MGVELTTYQFQDDSPNPSPTATPCTLYEVRKTYRISTLYILGIYPVVLHTVVLDIQRYTYNPCRYHVFSVLCGAVVMNLFPILLVKEKKIIK